MSLSNTPRESIAKRVTQAAAGGAPYDPDFVANGTKAERIAYIRAINAKTAAAAASPAPNGTDVVSASVSTAGATPALAGATTEASTTGPGDTPAIASAGTTSSTVPDAAHDAAVDTVPAKPARRATVTAGAPAPAATPTPRTAPATPAVKVAAQTAHRSPSAAEARAPVGGEGASSKVIKVAAVVAAGAVATGVIAYVGSAIAAWRRQSALVAALSRSFADDSHCHLFASPHTALSLHRGPACTEVEVFLRLARIPYVVHFVEHGEDLRRAVNTFGEEVQRRLVTTAHGLGEEATRTRQAEGEQGKKKNDAVDSGWSEDDYLPVLVHRDEAICVGSRSIMDYGTKTFGVTLDARLSQADLARGALLRQKVAGTMTLYMCRTLCDHARVWARVEGVQHRAALPTLTGWYYVWRARACGSSAQRALADDATISVQSREAYEAALLDEVVALEKTLEANAFLLGSAPSSCDCAVYAFLLPLFTMDEATVAGLNEACAHLRHSKPLNAYMQRLAPLITPDPPSVSPSAARSASREGATTDSVDARALRVVSAPSAGRSTPRSTSRRPSQLGAPRETVNTRAAEASAALALSNTQAEQSWSADVDDMEEL